MQRRALVLAMAAILAAFAATQAFGGATPKWKVGDRVEVQDTYTSTYEKGTISDVQDYRSTYGEWAYHAHLDRLPPGSTQQDLLVRESQVRAISTFVPKFKRGSTVDTYYAPGQGHSRGTVLAVTSNGYRVHYTGCNHKFDETLDHSLVTSPHRLSRSSAAARYLIGKWIMFTPSYPNTVIHNGSIYHQYGTGARTPPLVIKSNGLFVWYFDFGKKPVRGHWKTDAKIPGATTGTESLNGLVIHDPSGHPWKVYKRRAGGGKRHITAERMCFGITDIGTAA